MCDPKILAENQGDGRNGITYEKGGAVLSMLESLRRPLKCFAKGVNAYLRAHAKWERDFGLTLAGRAHNVSGKTGVDSAHAHVRAPARCAHADS